MTRVRRRGQPRRAGRGEGHLRLPARLRQLQPRHLRDQAVAERGALLGAERVPGAPGWDGGNPRPNPPIHQKGLLTYGDGPASPRSPTCRLVRDAPADPRGAERRAGVSWDAPRAACAPAPRPRRSGRGPQIAEALGPRRRSAACSASAAGCRRRASPSGGPRCGRSRPAAGLVVVRAAALARVGAQEHQQQPPSAARPGAGRRRSAPAPRRRHGPIVPPRRVARRDFASMANPYGRNRHHLALARRLALPRARGRPPPAPPGLVPGVVYGGTATPQPFEVEAAAAQHARPRRRGPRARDRRRAASP